MVSGRSRIHPENRALPFGRDAATLPPRQCRRRLLPRPLDAAWATRCQKLRLQSPRCRRADRFRRQIQRLLARLYHPQPSPQLRSNGEGGKIGEKILKQSGERLVEIAAWLMAMSRAAGPDQIHITIEFHTVPGRNADRVQLQSSRHQPQAHGALSRPFRSC